MTSERNPEVTQYGQKHIFINTGRWDEKALAHGMIHLLGIATGRNGYRDRGEAEKAVLSALGQLSSKWSAKTVRYGEMVDVPPRKISPIVRELLRREARNLPTRPVE